MIDSRDKRNLIDLVVNAGDKFYDGKIYFEAVLDISLGCDKCMFREDAEACVKAPDCSDFISYVEVVHGVED